MRAVRRACLGTEGAVHAQAVDPPRAAIGDTAQASGRLDNERILVIRRALQVFDAAEVRGAYAAGIHAVDVPRAVERRTGQFVVAVRTVEADVDLVRERGRVEVNA